MATLPRRRARRALAAALGALILGAGCGGDGPSGPSGPRVGDIVFQPSPLTLRQREVHRLTTSVTDEDGNLISGIVVTFASTNESIVTVSSLGEVTSVGPAGTASIRATAGGFSKLLPVTVEGIATSVRVTPSPASVVQKGTLQLQAKVLDLVDGEIAGQPFEYQSGNAAIATVNAGGIVTSTGPAGTVDILVRSGGLSQTVPVTVTQVVGGISALPGTIFLGAGHSAQLRPSLVDLVGAPMPAGAAFTYASSNTATATVDGQGLVQSIGPLGDVTLTVRSGTFEKTVTLRVQAVTSPIGAIVGLVPVPNAFGVAFAPNGTAYAVSHTAGLYRLDLDARTAAPITPGTPGLDVVISPDGARAYVAEQARSLVHLVDLATGTLVRSSGPIAGAALTDILAHDAQTLWVGSGAGIVVLDATTLQPIQAPISSATVVHVARHPTLPYLYASGQFGGVAEVDMTTRTIRRSFPLGGTSQGVAVSPDGSELYVADESSSSVRVVTLATGTVAATIPLGGGGGYGLVASSDGLRVYVTQSGAGRLVIIDVATRTVSQAMPLPAGTPRRMALSPDGSTLLVAHENGGVTIVK